jgi:hypothetical protein
VPECAWAERVFADGFEASCALDTDTDGLMDCEEAQAGTLSTNADTDGDGLSDGDELLGTAGGLDLPALGVDPLHQDILLEYDWFADANDINVSAYCVGPHDHKPSALVLERVAAAFAAAPVDNPDGTTGINVIQDVGQGGVFDGGSLVPDSDGVVIGGAAGAEYKVVYDANMAANRRGYFHYVLMAHRYILPNLNNSSGSATTPGDRIMITLQCQPSVQKIGNTIVHELGHNLGLQHGGDGSCNGKPNYNSVMNYRYQFTGIDLNCDRFGDGIASYSMGTNAVLDENTLIESAGICAAKPMDWNGNSVIDAAAVQVEINNLDWTWEGKQLENCGGLYTQLSDYDDWSSIQLELFPVGGGVPVKDVGPPCPPVPN